MEVDGAAGPPTAVPPLVNLGDQRLPAIRAGHRRVRAPATNAGTVSPGLVSWIQLDTSQLGAFLDPQNSYLQFDVVFKNLYHKNKIADAALGGSAEGYGKKSYVMYSNSGAASHIESIRIYVQGNCIEELTNYGAAQELMCDFNGNGQHVHNPPVWGGAANADDENTWGSTIESTFTGTAVVGAVPNNYQPAGTVASTYLRSNQRFPAEQSPFDYNDPGIKMGAFKSQITQLDRKLGRPRTFDSMLLHQNRIITSKNQYVNDATSGVNTADDSITLTCCIPLLSSYLGVFAKKAFPLLEFAPGSVQIQITWAQQYVPFYAMYAVQHTADGEWVFSTTPSPEPDTSLNNITWQISNINFVHKVIVMPAEVAGVIMSRQAQADTTLRVQQLRHYILPRLTSGTKTYNIIVPAKIQSASALYLCFRAENLNKTNIFSSCRYNPGFYAHTEALKVQVRVGSEYVPTQAITTGPELFAETIKAINKLSSTAGETLLDDAHYFGSIDDVPNPGTLYYDAADWSASKAGFHTKYLNKQCPFCIGIDFDSFSGSTDTTRSGMFLGNNTMTVELIMPDGVGPSQNYTCDAWFLHDAELVIRSTGVAVAYY